MAVALLTAAIGLHNNRDLTRLLIWQHVDIKANGSPPQQHRVVARLRQLKQMPLFDPSNPPNNSWTAELFQRLDRIRANCGELCAIDSVEALDKYNVGPHNHSAVSLPRQLAVPVDCEAIIMDEDIDVGDLSVPHEPPEELIPYYTLNGLVPFELGDYGNQTYVGTDSATPMWTVDTFEPIIRKIDANFGTERHIATYGRQPNDFAENIHLHIDLKGKRVLVIGTEYPWLEGLALWFGAAHVTTLEYGKIVSTHPNVTTLLPSEFRQQWKDGTLGMFDVVLSFSSLEHPGLGRYGDALNPWGDLLAVARAHCVTKPGGYLGLGLMALQRRDFVRFNAFRNYGPIRWPLITANWQQIDGAQQRLTDNYSVRKGNKRNQPIIFQKPLE
ncbi:hypothetical protein ACHAXN_008056 [Cyclotella atomus]